MTASQLVKMLQEQIAKRPETGNKEILVLRDNGKRTFRRHNIETLGWRKLTDYSPHGHVAISLSFDGEKY